MSVVPPSSVRDPFAPPSKPLPPPPPKPLRQRPIFWVAIGLCALIVVGASAGLTILLWPRKAPPLPYDPTRLPESMRSIHRWKPDPKLPRELEASELATVCGGVNVTRLAMDLDRPLANEVLADAIAARAETQKALVCGAAIAKNLGDGPRYVIHLKDEKKTRYVFIYPLTLETMPSAAKNFALSGGPKDLASIGCIIDGGKGTCPEKAWAIAKIPGTTLWLSGRLEDLDTVSSAYKGRAEDEQTRQLSELALHFEGFESVELGNADSEFYFRAMDSLDDFSEEVRKAETGFRKSLEAANAVYGFGESEGFRDNGQDHDHLEITMKREEDATIVAKALKELRLALKHAKPHEYSSDVPRVQRKAREAYVSMYKRAIDDAEVEQKGSVVSLDLALKPEPDERTALLDRDKDTADRAKHAVDLYKALLKGEKPSDEVIQAVGGRDLARAVTERKDGPPENTDAKLPVNVESIKDFVVPAGADNEQKSTTRYVYQDAKTSLVDDALRNLREAGWTVRLVALYNGGSYECTKDDQVVELSISIEKHAIALEIRPN